jgi:DNA-binding SARP family transcriptional activator
VTQLSQRRSATPSADPRPERWAAPGPVKAASRRRVLAALSLATLTLGVPTVLAVVIGWPLPDALPALDDVRAVLTSPLASSLIIDILALVAWGAWAHFVVCVLAELAAASRRWRLGQTHEAVRVPGGQWSQGLARRLVEAAFATAVATSVGVATFSGTMLTPARPAAAAAPMAPVESIAQHAAAAIEEPAAGPAAQPVGRHQTPVALPEYVVQAPHGGYYDSLWDIAERFLGDGQRWREVYDLNENREQPDGRALTCPDLIRPGWHLQLPTDATGLAAAPASDEAPRQPSTVKDAPGESPGAPDTAGTPSVHVRPEAAPLPASPPPSAEPLAGAPAPSPTAEASPPPTDDADETSTADDDEVYSADVQFFGCLLAASAVAVLAALRHRQRRRRAPGQSIPTPGPELRRAEVILRVRAEPADLTFVDESLRALSLTLQEMDGRLPDVRSACLREGTFDFSLGQPSPHAPQPFLALGDGWTWRVLEHARPLVTAEQAGRVIPLLPLMLTVGRDEHGSTLLDLEAVGSLAVEGPAADVRGVLSHLVAEAALAPWAEDAEIVLVGFDRGTSEDLESLAPDRVTAVDELGPALLRVLTRRAGSPSSAEDGLARRVRSGAAEAQAEVPVPLLLVLADVPSTALGEQLDALVPAAGRAPVTVVAPGPWTARATWRLGGPLPIPGENPGTQPSLIQTDQLRALADLIRLGRGSSEPVTPESATRAADHAASTPPLPPISTAADVPAEVRSLTPRASSTIAAPEPATDGEPDVSRHDALDEAVDAFIAGTAPVSVALLGPVTVSANGNVDPDRRARLTEIVAYLATHQRGVAVSDFDAALWPDRQVTLKTRNQAITRARAWLGSDDDGVSWLRPMSDGALRLSKQVLVDWDLFQALHRRSQERGRSASAVCRDLQTAMSLVRGRVLSPLPAGRYGWLADTFLEQEIPSAVIDVAHVLACSRLEASDAAGAIDVARTALEVDRYDERPWRDLLEAHHLRGDTRQVATLVDQLRELLEVELDDELQPETTELIERLLPRRRHA